jgi:PTH1 family peptidyl-tRNA hydrolase
MMNLSGKAVIAATNFYKIKPEEVLVVHDDLDIKLGAFKMHFSKGPKVHNGILSIENRFGTPDFWHEFCKSVELLAKRETKRALPVPH